MSADFPFVCTGHRFSQINTDPSIRYFSPLPAVLCILCILPTAYCLLTGRRPRCCKFVGRLYRFRDPRRWILNYPTWLLFFLYWPNTLSPGFQNVRFLYNLSAVPLFPGFQKRGHQSIKCMQHKLIMMRRFCAFGGSRAGTDLVKPQGKITCLIPWMNKTTKPKQARVRKGGEEKRFGLSFPEGGLRCERS